MRLSRSAERSKRIFTRGAVAGNAVCRCDPSCEKAILENPRLRSNESPSGAFKRQSGLRKQMEGLCPDKLRRFSRIANIKIYFPLKMARAQRRPFKSFTAEISIKTTPGFSTFRRKDVENPGALFLQNHQLLALVSFTILAAGSLPMAELLRVLAIWAP